MMRTNPKTLRPVTGTVAIQTGEIGEDLSFYLVSVLIWGFLKSDHQLCA